MAKPKQIEFGTQQSGIQVTYIKSKDTLEFFGWYDTYVGIEGGSISMKEFCEKLGIKRQ